MCFPKTKFTLSLAFLLLFAAGAFAQSISVKGTVADASGNPLPGAVVVVRGTSNAAISTLDGKFEIEGVGVKSELEVSYVGFISQVIPVNGRADIDIVMQEDKTVLEEVVVVGYGVQKVGTVTGSVAQIKSDKLTMAPVGNVNNALAGRMPGLFVVQNCGLPGSDAANLSIRGFGAPLVIVDGVEGQIDQLNPEQIESVSILKDGAASIYGARAGNGVILVTTKRGVNQKPTITYSGSFTLQGATRFMKPANSWQWAEMEREAFMEGGGSSSAAPWTPEDIQKFKDGNDPNYPNTDWYDVVFRDWAPQHNHSVSLRGGTDRISYYGYVGYLNQATMIKKNGGGYTRFNLQSNVDIKVLDNLKLSVDLSYINHNKDYTERSMGDGGALWQDLATTKPYYPASFPDKTKIPYADGAGTGGVHVSTNREIYGYCDSDTHTYFGTAVLTYDFKYIKGLNLKLTENVIMSHYSYKDFTKPVDLYIYDSKSDTYTLKAQLNGSAQLWEVAQTNRTWTQQLSLNYDRDFGKHHVSGMALWELLDFRGEEYNASRKNFITSSIDYLFAGDASTATNHSSAQELGRQSVVGRANYAYDEKYLAEFIIRADASSRFAKGYRWGYFPSISLGWVISKENFLKNVNMLDKLKIRASYGLSGDDSVASFAYLSGYGIGQYYQIGDDDDICIYSTGMANPTLSWETMTVINGGIDFSLFKRKLYGSVDVFSRLREGIPGRRHISVPSTFGVALPLENLNSISTKGLDFSLGSSKGTGEFTYDISANLSWYESRWAYYDEPEYDDPEQARIYKKTGHKIGELWGYKSDGLLATPTDIINLGYDMDEQNNRTLTPGGIKLIDNNDDGVVNWKDQVVICDGNTPHWMYGINLTFAYKGFDLSAVIQGAFGYSIWVNSGRYTDVLYEGRWSPSNMDPNAIFPHLAWTKTDNYVNDFNVRKAGYMRVKTFTIGYNLPKSLLARTPITNARIYLAGNNLITLDRLAKFGLDPEAITVGRSYPQQKTISIGLNVSF